MSDPSSVVAVAPIIEILKPLIDVVVPPAVVGLVGIAIGLIRKYTGAAISAQAEAKLESAAATQAGILVARAENNLAGQSVTLGSSGIAEAAEAIEAALPEAMALTGATPDKLKALVVGEIGKLQALAGAPPAAK
jgi:hypothetical protein